MVSESQSGRPMETLVTEWEGLYLLQVSYGDNLNIPSNASIVLTETDLGRCNTKKYSVHKAQALSRTRSNCLKGRLPDTSLFLLRFAPEVIQRIFLLVCDENFIGEVTANILGAILVRVCNGFAYSGITLVSNFGFRQSTFRGWIPQTRLFRLSPAEVNAQAPVGAVWIGTALHLH